MSYIPFSEQERQLMLQSIGVSSVDELFQDIPASKRLKQLLNIPPALSELDISRYLTHMADENQSADKICFLGAGAYDHYVPSAINHLISRGEFFTAYTPYQPEASQGTLQYIFEFQSLVCSLTGMDAANASMYDASSGLAEAAMMTSRGSERKKILVSKAIHPQYRETIKTYLDASELSYEEIALADGITSMDDLKSKLDAQVAGVLIQYPNFLGNFENMTELEKLIHANQSMFVTVVNPISLARLKPPGEYSVDICVMEGQPLGNAMSFGGPYLGILSCKTEHLRKMPGRLVGMAKDHEGRNGFVLTLQAREQHIRRSKATSNICSNQSLNALCATIYLCLLGKTGMQQQWDLNYQKAHYAFEEICKIPGFKSPWASSYFFNEFTIECPQPAEKILSVLDSKNILGGYSLSQDYPEIKNGILCCVTEKRTKSEIDQFIDTLKQL